MSGSVHIEREYRAEFFDPVWTREWCHKGGDSNLFLTDLGDMRACSGLGIDDPFQIRVSADSVKTLTVGSGVTFQEHLISSDFSNNEERLRTLAEQLCIGLLRLHNGLGVRHGAISPFNLRISGDGSASLWSIPTLGIAWGRVERTLQSECLLEQPYYKDYSQTVKDHLKGAIGRLGERLEIKRFTRHHLQS